MIKNNAHFNTALIVSLLLTGCAATKPASSPIPPMTGFDQTPGVFIQESGMTPSNNPIDMANAAPIDDLPATEAPPDEAVPDVKTSALFVEAQEPVYTDDQAPAADEDSEAAPTTEDVLIGNNAQLWQRMRANMSLSEKNHRSVTSHVTWFASHPTYLERTFDRARPFMHYILNETLKRGMPAEIALLPVVESAFQPFAYSRARASGIWQFIPDTGRRYGLKINWWYDGRRDVISATDAALNYLQDLHKQFDGDWLLALAAYNSGEGNVARAIERNLKRKRRTDFWSLDLPRETRGYVPRLLAIAALVENPQRYGVTLRHIPDEPYFTPVYIDAQIDMALASELAGISIEDMYHLNPGHNRWATDPAGPHHLLLPLSRATEFSINLAEVPHSKRVHWQQHTIQRNETLKHVAATDRSTPEILREINNLSNHPLRVGQSLLIPTTTNTASPFVPAGIRQDSLVVARGNSQTNHHVVRAGDTLWNVGRRYRVSHLKLAEWNKLSPGGYLAIGKKLIVRQSKNEHDDVPAGSPAQAFVRYVVRKGDTLTQIALRFNVTVRNVLSWNTQLLGGGALLRPGQALTLFVNNDNSRTKS